jgi:16S rRNA (uracil1498-N3)-methyltransferase
LIVIDRKTGTAIEAIIVGFDDNHFKLKVAAIETSQPPISRAASICVALSKGHTTDIICEKATELGVQRIIFWEAKHSVLRASKKGTGFSGRTERLSRIAEAASKQSQRRLIPEVYILDSLSKLFSKLDTVRSPSDRLLVASLCPEARPLRIINPNPSLAHLLIGPEGDLSADEQGLIRAYGFEEFSLGPLRLRTETAAIAAVVAVNEAWGFTHDV